MLALTSICANYAPSTPTHLRRIFSCILSSFSWNWDGIVIDPQDFGKVAERLRHKNFLLSWQVFERDVLKLTGDSRFQDILRVLAIGLEFSQTPPRSFSIVSSHEPSLSVFDYQRLCNVLAGYRFAELLVLRDKIGCRVLKSTAVRDIYLPPSTNSRNTPHGFERLQDWPTILSTFRAAVNKSGLTCPQTDIPDGASRLLILMRLLVRSELRTQYVNIENNFLYAALHIYAFNMGIFPEGVIPNLPGEQKNVQIQFADEVSQQEYAEVTTTLLKHYDLGPSGGNSGHASLCAPLHLALFISPIYLLFPFRIVKQSFHRRCIIEVSHKLGPHKPSIVLNIENLIWDAVFAISERPLDIKDIIIKLASHIFGIDMNFMLCSPAERSWFSLSDDLSRTIPGQDHTRSETEKLPLQHAASPSPPSGTGRVESPPPHSWNSEMIEDPVTMDADADIHQTCNSQCPSSPLTMLTPSTIPSSPAGDAQEVPTLSSRPAEDTCNPNCVDVNFIFMANYGPSDRPREPMFFPSMAAARDEINPRSFETQIAMQDESKTLDQFLTHSNQMVQETIDPVTITVPHSIGHSSTFNSLYDGGMSDLNFMDAEQLNGPSGSEMRGIDDVDSESESDETKGSARSHKRKIVGIDYESSVEVPESPPRSHKRKIVDIESESESEQNEGPIRSHGHSNTSRYISDSNAMGTKPSPSKVSSQRPRPKRSRTSAKQRPKAQKKSLTHHREALPTLSDKGNSASNPIDIDAFYSLFEPSVIKEYVEKEEISFARDTAPIKTESTFDLHAFDAGGSQIYFKIKAHYPLFLERIKQFFDHATADYVQGMPRRFTDHETSILRVITYETLSTLGPDAIQQMFSSKNIVVTGCPRDVNLKFDSYGLRTLTGSMSTQISITDFSTMAASGDDNEPCVPSVLSGVVQDLLDNAQDTETSKILNALDFPLWDGSRDRNAYATDMAAWDVTRGLHIFDPSALYPTGDVRWGLAGLKNSMTFLHIDPDGFHTENTIGVGGKAWGILRERPGLKTSSTDFYLDDGFCLNEIIDGTQYDFEIIALQPGDRIYMRPNTPHFVFGTENSICYGGHFYSTLTMPQTLSGVIHSFILDKFLTNTAHQASRQLLRRMLVFYLHGLMDKKISTEDFAWAHLPNLDGIDGLMSLLSLCVLVILGNVLDFRTYTASSLQQAQPLTEAEKWLMTTYDINGIPTNERLAMCYTRGAALHLFQWVRECCIIHGPEESVVEDLPSRFLTQIGRAIIHYKTRAEEKNLEGVTHCSLAVLTSQINNVMESDNDIRNMWTDNSEEQPDSLELKSQSKYRLEWKAGWESSGSWTSIATDYKNDGCTMFDLTYFNAQAKRVHAEHSRMTSLFGPNTHLMK